MSHALDLDRISPTQRPDIAPAGTQRWRSLLFAHWSFPLEAVRPLVPSSLELDPWDGRIFVGLVPFAMEAIRSSWMPRPTALDFLETNVRTYVHHRGEPGVFFLSLEASSWLAVRVARLVWSLPYFHAEMTSSRHGDTIDYRSTRKSGSAIVDASWTIGEPLGPSEPGSLEHFLLERYLLFSEKGGRLRKGQVHHTPYPARRASLARMEETLLGAAGLPVHTSLPEVVHYSEGVDVEVFGPWDCESQSVIA
jgi:uncharacterized protein